MTLLERLVEREPVRLTAAVEALVMVTVAVGLVAAGERGLAVGVLVAAAGRVGAGELVRARVTPAPPEPPAG